jgi:V-type H+-transporting ATPase proteolipid subunit
MILSHDEFGKSDHRRRQLFEFAHPSLFQMAAEDCQVVAAFFAFLGVAFALAFTAIGSGYGTAKSSIGVFAVCAMHPEFIYRGLMPIIMAGISGLVRAVLVARRSRTANADSSPAMPTLPAVSLRGLALGCRLMFQVMRRPRHGRAGAMLILIFCEVLGLHGFVISIILSSKRKLAQLRKQSH